MSTQDRTAPGHSPEGVEKYRRLTQAWNAAFDARNAEKIASYYAEDVMVVDPVYPEPLRGREAVQQDIAEFMTSVPDAVTKVQEILVDGTRVATRIMITGTHTGSLPTPSRSIPPTGRLVRIPISFFIYFSADSKIAEEYRYYDLAGMAEQQALD
jgi:steroid delta-isomerase-like uncharacterized protein